MNLRTLAPLSLALLACTATTSALAQQKVDPARSEISFVSKQMGVPVEGRFRKFDAQIAFDPKKPEAGKVAFTIDLGSTTLGNPETDAELPKAAWFNVPKFPQASFQSTSIKGVGSGRFAFAAPETYNIDPTHTFPSFSYSHFGMSTQMSKFDKTTGTVTLDKEAKTGAVDITIDMKSVNTGYETFDGTSRARTSSTPPSTRPPPSSRPR
jgi:polyisoprenoid-binding protein YceI